MKAVIGVCLFAFILAVSGLKASPEQRAKELLAKMTLEEKVTMVHGDNKWVYVGSVPANTRLGIPAINMEDGPQGVADGVRDVTAWPAALTVAATWDVELMKAWGAAMAEEQLNKGTNVMLGPMFNIDRCPLAGRNFESFGEDPVLAGELARAQIIGIQGKGIMACAKHFADNSQGFERTEVSEDVPERVQYELFYPAFKASVDAGVLSVMCSYNKINGTWACENPTIMRALKEEMGYKFFVMSDWGATHSTVASALAGLDQEMPDPHWFGQGLLDAIKQGKVPMSRLDDMVFRILNAMFTIGLFDREPFGNLSVPVNTEAHRQFAHDLAAAGTVLLKNSGDLLPLDERTIKRVAVIGDDAGINGIAVGQGSGNVQLPHMNSVYNGIARRVGYTRPRNCTVEKDIDYYQPGNPYVAVGSADKCAEACANELGCNVYTYVPKESKCWLKETNAGRQASAGLISGSCAGARPSPRTTVTYTNSKNVQAAVDAARAADVVVISLGTSSGEGIDRTNLDLPDAALVSAVVAANPRTVVAIHAPGMVVMPWHDQVRAIVFSLLPGSENGNSLASILFGDVNPAGRLPISLPLVESDTWIKTKEQYPGVNGHVAYSEGLQMGYRWYSAQGIKPRYMFGHGLSYTTFEYNNFELEHDQQDVWVSFTVKNTGNRAGGEVSQMYLTFPSSAEEPPKQLRGFVKNYLIPGQSVDLEFHIKPKDRSIWNVYTHSWQVVTGQFTVFVGSTFDNTPLTGTVDF